MLYPVVEEENEKYELILRKAREVCEETIGHKKRFETQDDKGKLGKTHAGLPFKPSGIASKNSTLIKTSTVLRDQ